MKLTRHNGRSGKHGTYNPRHNDRRFDVENSEHIDAERARQNIYWDCYRGFTTHEFRENPEQPDFSFEEIERMYYYEHYSDHMEAQNARNEKTRHTERNRTVEDLLKNNKTCPEESIYQIGTLEESVPPETLFRIVNEFYEEFERRFGSHIHILDWALHLDEGTPHIHERHVFDCQNRYGELCPQQEKALEELGIPLPNQDKPKGRHNNRKQTFDAVCRTILFDITKRHGLHLDQEPSYGGREYLEKQGYTINRAAHKSTRYYIDEMHLLLKEEQTAAYTVEIWKRFRKWGGIPTGITQNVKDLLSSREVENIFENSDFVYMLNQAGGDRQILAKQLGISPHQLSYVTHSSEGEGLLFYGSTILPFVDHFPKNTELYRIMTTKPQELKKEDE